MKELMQDWREAKEQEIYYREKRRDIEARILSVINHDENEPGSKKFNEDNLKMIVRQRMSCKINTKKLRAIADRNQINLDKFIQWEPKIDAKKWKKADPQIRGLLSQAVKLYPSKPSIIITD